MGQRRPSNGIEDFEQVVFVRDLYTCSTLNISGYRGPKRFASISVFGQMGETPLVAVREGSGDHSHETFRGALLGSFVEIEGTEELVLGQVVQGGSLALRCDGEVVPVPIPDGKMELVVPTVLPLL